MIHFSAPSQHHPCAALVIALSRSNVRDLSLLQDNKQYTMKSGVEKTKTVFRSLRMFCLRFSIFWPWDSIILNTTWKQFFSPALRRVVYAQQFFVVVALLCVVVLRKEEWIIKSFKHFHIMTQTREKRKNSHCHKVAQAKQLNGASRHHNVWHYVYERMKWNEMDLD